jgi:hypothetical protein
LDGAQAGSQALKRLIEETMMQPVSHVSWSKIMLDALKLLHAVPGSGAAPCKTQRLFLKLIAKITIGSTSIAKFAIGRRQ